MKSLDYSMVPVLNRFGQKGLQLTKAIHYHRNNFYFGYKIMMPDSGKYYWKIKSNLEKRERFNRAR